jgi:hypothetical protein
MKTEIRDQRSEIRTSGSGEFENTLRLIARISAPEGLEERVQAGLRAEASAASGKARILRWPEALRLNYTTFQNLAWLQNLARTAAAAAIVAVVVGGGWSISSRFRPVQPSSAVAVPPHSGSQGGFSSAGAMRTPQTLNGPVVAHPAEAAPQTAKPAGKTQVRHGKPAAAKRAVTQTAPAAKLKQRVLREEMRVAR